MDLKGFGLQISLEGAFKILHLVIIQTGSGSALVNADYICAFAASLHDVLYSEYYISSQGFRAVRLTWLRQVVQ